MTTINRLFLSLLLLLISPEVLPCTAIIISGKATPDGRPILWKNRDTDQVQNAVMVFNDGKYHSIGVINSNDKKGESVWIGYNSAGFAIMNTVSYNLIARDTVKLKNKEGEVMRKALQNCATVDEFEEFLMKAPKPLGIETNFGVIDASGGAAWFEADNFSFKKLDVNDPAQAPMGYIIHTNFSFFGDPKQGSGQIRYKTAEELFFQAQQENNLTVRFILQKVSRSLWHSLTMTDLKSLDVREDEERFVNFVDFIPRNSTTATIAVQGILPGENPDYTTMWTILGFPLTSVVMPLWLCAGMDQPGLVLRDEKEVAPLCDKALLLKKKLFPIVQAYGVNYLNLSLLYNRDQTGYMQVLKPLEDMIFETSLKKLEIWRKNPAFRKEIPGFYREINDLITATYSELFGI